MTSQDKKTKNNEESTLSATFTGKPKEQDDFVTIEVVCLKDIPLVERYKEASKPLYLTRYE